MKGCLPMQVIQNFALLFVLVLWVQYEIRKHTRISKKGIDEFWKKEALANQTRKSDISTLEYISIPLHDLPLNDTEDSTMNAYRDTILSLADKKILNLSGFTNTELKLQYGTANLALLTECDTNYAVLISTLHKWGERLANQGNKEDAIAVLELAVRCHTDAKNTYRLLAKLYQNTGSQHQLENLRSQLSCSNNESLQALSKIL